MCVSAATLNLREARQLEWETLSSDEEDELPSSWTGLGLPDGYLDTTEAALSGSNSGCPEAALLPWLTEAQRLAAEVHHQFQQLQLVRASLEQCIFYAQKAPAQVAPCRQLLSVG